MTTTLSASFAVNDKTKIRGPRTNPPDHYPSVSLDTFNLFISVVDPDKAQELGEAIIRAANMRREAIEKVKRKVKVDG